MVIVEGPDGAGKSTLIKQLHADTGIPVHERAVRDKTGPDERNLWDWTHLDMANWGQVYLYDRHPLVSEYIYGPVTRGGVAPGFERTSAAGLRQRLAQQCLLVLCLPPYSTTLANITKEEQMEGVRDNHAAIYELYRTLLVTWNGWYKLHDYTNPEAYEGTLRAVRIHAAQWRKTA